MIKEPLTRLSIDGKFINTFNSIELKQKINDHHTFKIILDNDVVENIGGHSIDKSKEWLSRPVVITFDETEFLGVITNINLENKHGHHGKLILKGYSPTILLQGQPHFASWTNRTLQQIVSETLQNLELGKDINPTFKEPLEYQSQYNENHFQFLQRLAKQYKQWFYYNGVGIVFGKPEFSKNTVHIEYGADIDNLSLKIKIKDHKQKKIAYNASADQQLYAKSKEQVQGLNELAFHAFNISNSKYTNETLSFTSTQADSKYLLDNYVEQQQAQASANLHTLKGKSNKQGLNIGSIIKVKSARTIGKNNIDKQNYGEYVITEITHKASLGNKYQNKFTAIPSGITIPKAPKVKLPIAEPQIATVTDNADAQGRVKVRFLWQVNNQTTSWIRVASPNAGSSNHHQQNRGQVFIPEIDDQVMVGFEHNNPNAPFVIGSMFHGQNGAGGKANNNIKSIITRSGHVIELNDSENAESITITDKNNNKIFFDTANKSIYINAPTNINIIAGETINMKAKDLNIDIENNIDIKASNNIKKIAKNDIIQNSGGKTFIDSQKNMSISSTKELDLFGKKQLIQHSNRIDIGSSNILHVHGKNTMLTAIDKIEYKAPSMDKLPEKGDFEYTKEPEVISVYWMDGDLKMDIFSAIPEEEVSIYAQTRNFEEGQTLTLKISELNNKDIKSREKEVSLTGTVDSQGIAQLQRTLKIEEI